MEGKYYTSERSIQILISLLKAHNIKKCVLSPGTTISRNHKHHVCSQPAARPLV